jgi:hypothetical protein
MLRLSPFRDWKPAEVNRKLPFYKGVQTLKEPEREVTVIEFDGTFAPSPDVQVVVKDDHHSAGGTTEGKAARPVEHGAGRRISLNLAGDAASSLPQEVDNLHFDHPERISLR